eukprot:CAMPEP_0172844122 /NCGR_PEP_ID=MMETSP1075-20121228/31972_1 /TAXON_ID=2916 /ORGANISM="Ceratium fusus, Strain PA161109" /LENGTH=431 /DNA_ID=CAMNT_0013688507 /DNA_START=119 /DNA_END=1411 /DNA_ORIENTATION=+
MPVDGSTGEDSLRRLWHRWEAKPLCTPGAHNYFGQNQHERWTNHTCVRPCVSRLKGSGCWQPSEVYDGTDGQLFVATHLRETVVSQGGTWQTATPRNFFVPFAEAFTVGVTYQYNVPKPTWYGVAPYNVFSAERISASSDQNIRTVIVDNDGEELRTVQPGSEILLTVKDILKMAGQEGKLDRPNDLAFDNPITRLTGMELVLLVDCTSADDGPNPVCHLSVRRSSTVWTRHQRGDFLPDGSLRRREFNGLRLRFEATGRHRRFSLEKLANTVATLVVLSRFPRSLVMFVCIYMLGHLSAVYSQVLVQTFNLQEFMGGLSLRLLVANTAFLELMDTSLTEGGGVISSCRMREMLGAILKKRGKVLDEKEVSVFASYCFRSALLEGTGKQISSAAQEVHKAFSKSTTLARRFSFDSITNSDSSTNTRAMTPI